MVCGQPKPFLELDQAQAFLINKADSELTRNNLSPFFPVFCSGYSRKYKAKRHKN